MPPPASATDLRNRIAVLLQDSYKAYELDGVCVSFGIPGLTEPPAYNSKRVEVQQRLARVQLPEMLEIARRVNEELHDPALAEMIGTSAGIRGVDGELKNLIFAPIGTKPRIVLRDAINNTIEIAEGADRCLVYDRTLAAGELLRGDLLDWWKDSHHPDGGHGLGPEQTLSRRLSASLESDAEKVLARAYGAYVITQDNQADVPALIPQVYLHYDPYTARELRTIRNHGSPRALDGDASARDTESHHYNWTREASVGI